MTNPIKLTLIIPESLRQLGKNLDPGLQEATVAVANELKSEARPYPGASNSPVIWSSDAQRKAYFASRKDLEPQYSRQNDPRSQRIMESWSVEPEGARAASLSNSATYANWVIGERQSEQHAATGWRKLSDVAREYFATTKPQQVFEKVLEAFINRKL